MLDDLLVIIRLYFEVLSGASTKIYNIRYLFYLLSNHVFTMKNFNSKTTTQIIVTIPFNIFVPLIAVNILTYLINLSYFIPTL